MKSRQDLIDAILHSNPFDSNRVTPATSEWADVPQIHDAAFLRLQRSAEAVHQTPSSRGVLLWSEPGIGKSHLLARLGNWADAEPRPGLFLSLANLQAEPERIPRALLRAVIDLLTPGLAGRSRRVPLFRLANGMVRHALEGAKSAPPDQMARACRRMVDRWCQEAPARGAVLDRTLIDLFVRFFLSHLQRTNNGTDDGIAGLCVRYLRGDGIEREDAARLGLALNAEAGHAALADDEQVKKVFVVLAQLAWCWGRPMILALDQVDNLEPAQFHALGRFLHALLDSASNLLVITCGVRESLLHWRETRVLQHSSWDRIAQEEIELQRLSDAEGRSVVSARIDAFRAPFRDCTEIMAMWDKDPMFPLGQAWVAERIDGKMDLRPRDVLHWARQGWEQQQGKAAEQGPLGLDHWHATEPPSVPPPPITPMRVQEALDQTVRERLNQLHEKLKRELEVRDWDPEGVADCLKELARLWARRSTWPFLQDVQRVLVQGTARPTFHLILQHRLSATGPDVRLGVACLLRNSGNELTRHLERIAASDSLPDRLILVRDQRTDLRPGPKGKEHLDELQAQFREDMQILPLDLADLAHLRAQGKLLGDAVSHELEFALEDGKVRKISRADAFESLVRQNLYPGATLLSAILRVEPASADQAVLAQA